MEKRIRQVLAAGAAKVPAATNGIPPYSIGILKQKEEPFSLGERLLYMEGFTKRNDLN